MSLSDTWWIERECPRTDLPDEPCWIENITSYDAPTDVLMCLSHGEVVGHVVPGEAGPQ